MAKKAKYYQRPDGIYETIRRINGKRVAFRGRTVREVDQKLLAFREIEERGRLFKQIADEWEDAHFPTLAPNTLKSYKPATRRAVQAFGEDPAKEIKAPQIKRFIVAFAKQYPSRKTVANQMLILNLIFNYAIECGDIEVNPCTGVSLPKNLEKEVRPPASPEEEAIIRKSADKWLLPYLMLYTGLRKGEALALQDTDFQDGWISVTKSIYHINNYPYIKKPKTKAGERVVPILKPLANKLPNPLPKGYLFSSNGGKTTYTESEYRGLWEKWAVETGVKATAHNLRHSYATLLFESDIDAKDAQDYLGHADLKTTMDIYTAIRNARRQQTKARLEAKLAALPDIE